MNTTTEHTLQTKLRRFAEDLTPEEAQLLRVMRAGGTIEMLSPSLAAKAEQAAAALTPDEQAHLSLLVQQAGGSAATDEAADVEGYRIKLDQVQPILDGGGGESPFGLGRFALGVLGVVAIGLGGPGI